MKLDVSFGPGADPANSDQVEAALRQLHGNEDGFVILSRDPENYIQTNGAVVEQRIDGEQHRAANLRADDAAAVRRVFLAYLRGDPEFAKLARWEAFEPDPVYRSRRRSPEAYLFGVVALAILAALAAWQAGWV